MYYYKLLLLAVQMKDEKTAGFLRPAVSFAGKSRLILKNYT